MSKKAFLVCFNPMTRVVVDVRDDLEIDILDDPYEFAKIVRAAREQMCENTIAEYLNGENIDEIKEDTECPYNEIEDVL